MQLLKDDVEIQDRVKKIALEINKTFFEVIAANVFDSNALKILSKK